MRLTVWKRNLIYLPFTLTFIFIVSVKGKFFRFEFSIGNTYRHS